MQYCYVKTVKRDYHKPNILNALDLVCKAQMLRDYSYYEGKNLPKTLLKVSLDIFKCLETQ